VITPNNHCLHDITAT